MSDKIEYEDIFGKDAFEKAVQGVERLTQGFKDMATQIGNVAIEQKEFLNGFKINNSGDIKKLNDELAKANKTILELNNANKAAAQGEKELAQIRIANAKALQEEEKAQQQKLRTEKLSNAESKKSLTLYQEQSKLLRDLKNEYKNVALAQGQTSKAAQDLLAKITPLDAKLKQLDKTTGDNFRNVGNYSEALKGFGSSVNNILGAAGISVGLSAGVSFLKDSVGEFAKLEKSLKNLQAITGVSNKDLEFFSKNAEELGINVKGGAVAVVEAYKLIGSAKPELLENKDALNEVTKAAILLSQASGLELPQAATQLTQALNSFNAPAEDAGKFVNILSAASKLGAKEIPFVAEALSKFGGVAKSAGVSIEDSAAAIEILGAKIPQAETVGTNLRGIFIKMQTEAAKGGRAFKGLGGELDLLAPRVNDITYLTKVYGEQNLLAIQTLIQERDALDKFTEGITDTNAALEQAAINTDTFEQKQIRLENRWISMKAAIGAFTVDFFDKVGRGFDEITGKAAELDLAFSKNATDTANKRFAQKILEADAYKEALKQLKYEYDTVLSSRITPEEEKDDKIKIIQGRVFALTAAYEELNKAKKNAGIVTPPTDNGKKILTGEETPEEKAARLKKEEEDRKKSAKKTADDEAKLRKQIEDRNAASFTNEKQRQEAIIKLDFERRKKEIEQSKATKKTKDEALLTLELEYYNKLADIENKYIDEKEKKEKEARDKQKKEDDEAFDAAVKEAQRLTDIEDKEREEKKKKEKEAREQELKELFDVASKALSIAEKEIKDKEKLRQDALDREIEQRDSNIEEQKRRAEQGLSNTLAFEEKALKDAEAKKEEENKKALKREKALTFFKLLSANAEKDPNSALQKTITEMLLGEAIAGAFFKGTEKVEDDLKGNKVHNGRDGYVVAVDGSERVLTGEQNKLIGNMSNEDLAKLAHDYNNNKLLPNYMLNEGVNTSVSENIYASMQLSQMVKMNERLESVEEAIKNKPVSNTSFDNLGYIIREEIRNGLKTITKTPLTKGYGN